MPLNLEAVSQFKVRAKRRPNRDLYLKISIRFRKISNYGTAPLFGGGADGALGAVVMDAEAGTTRVAGMISWGERHTYPKSESLNCEVWSDT